MELKRICSWRNIMLLLVAAMINLVIFGYKITPSVKSVHDTSRISETSKTPEERRIIKQNKYIKQYPKTIQGVLDRAHSMKENKLFSDPASFSYNNIVKTEADYQPLLDVKLTLDNNVAIQEISEYFYTGFFSFWLIVLLVNSLYAERDNGMWQIVHVAPKGRFVLAGKRVGLVALISFTVCGTLYASTALLALFSMDGFSGLLAPLQNLEKFEKSTLLINMLEYLLLNFLWTFFAVFALVVIVFVLMTIFRNRKNVLIGITAFGIIEYLLYINIESNSVYKLFKHINVVNLFKMSEMCTTYNNIGFGTVVIGVGNLLIVVLAAAILFGTVSSVFAAACMKPFARTTIFAKYSGKLHELYQRLFAGFPHFLKEIHKDIVTAKGVWAMAAALLAAVYFSSTGMMSFSDEQNELDKVYLTHGGKDYTYITNYVRALNAQMQDAQHKVQEAEKQYENGEIEFKEYTLVMQYYEYCKQQMQGIQEPSEKLEYLKSLKQRRGIEGYMMSDRGYEQIFGESSIQRESLIGIVLLVAVVLLSFGSVKLERYSGMENIANASYKGIQKHHCVKMISCMTIAGLLSVCIYIIELYNLFHYYGMPYLDAPVQSLTFMEDVPFPVTVGQWQILLIFLKCTFFVVVSAVAYVIFLMIVKKGKKS